MNHPTHRHLPLLIACLAALLAAATTSNAKEPHTPKPGSKERADILNAVRDPLEDQLHQKVIFRVSHLKVLDGWAFLMAEQRTAKDKKIDYSGTLFESDTDFDEGVIAILRFKRGRWYSVQHSYFASDVWWAGLHVPLRAPAAIFPGYAQ